MRKIKVTVAVLLTLVLLASGAYVPRLVALILDWRNTGAVSLNPIASIELNIQQDVSAIGKLAMMSKMDVSIEIKEDKAGMTRDEVMDAVHSELRPYIDAQLIAYSEKDVQLQPCLMQVQNMPELQGIVWIVTISGDPADFSFIDLAIDDETGKLLRITYSSEKPLNAIFGVEALNVFADIFFSNLGIKDYWTYASSDLESAYVGDNGNAVRFRFGDAQYGEINVDLNVYDCGFYVEFPEVTGREP